uniref:gliding motility-associated C-terminal domain-containing protein n=1 Tax=Lutibacter sp. TaxID=1925666 RepID=UPI003562C483
FDPASGCESATRDSKTALIEIAPNAGTDGSYSDCEINLVDQNLFSLLGGADTGGTWTAPDGSAHSETFVAGTDVAGVYTYTAAGGTICPDDTSIVTVTITVVPPPTIADTTQTFCKSENALVSDLIPNDASIIWHDATGTVLAPTDPLSDGTYSASQTNDLSGTTCESLNKTDVTVIIYNPITPTTTNDTQEFCLSDSPTIANLQAEASNVAYTIVWYDATGSAPLTTDTALIDGAIYYAAETISDCESADRLSVTVTINDALPPTISTVTQSFCASSSPEISDLNVSGTGIVWYASETDNTPLNPTELLVDSEDYWAAQTNATTGCISSIREVVNVILTDPGTPAIISLGNEFCKIDKPTLAELNINVSANSGGTISWYDFYPNGNLLSTSIALVEGETYYAIETTVNSCESINPLAVTVSLEACDAYDVEIYDGFSPSGNGVNDTFKLGNLRDLYPNFKVEFFNRWGALVYTANASKPDWDGRLNGDGELVPAGVYYFIINFNKNDRKPIQRRLYLSR